MRFENRRPNELRPLKIQRHFTASTAGSVLIQAGRTTVLCTACLEVGVPPWKRVPEGEEPSGWVTAEYNMLPGSTSPRKSRDRNKVDGRTTEIQRLIGRSIRACVDFTALGARTITIDCDVLEADGGTRTLSITGGFIALCDALAAIRDNLGDRRVITESVAAVSIGVKQGELLLDLDYREDSRVDVDMNVVMTGSGEFIELQGTAEGQTFGRELLNGQLDLAAEGIAQLTAFQREALGDNWPRGLSAE
ncbi:MAG: ribonuclease PH [Planctomycetota bacterium]|nr:ribonuclease PH [Planctomycetota bacterium]